MITGRAEFVCLTSVAPLAFCSSRGLGTSGTLATTGRSRRVRCICTPASAQAPLELCTKGNGMVGMRLTWGRALSGVTSSTLTFSRCTLKWATRQRKCLGNQISVHVALPFTSVQSWFHRSKGNWAECICCRWCSSEDFKGDWPHTGAVPGFQKWSGSPEVRTGILSL